MAEEKRQKAPLKILGWREWVSLPTLSIPWIEAKVDTGARSSSLHAEELEVFAKGDETWLRFNVPLLKGKLEGNQHVRCECRLVDQRLVKSSTGEAQERFVIREAVTIAGETHLVDITLSQRDGMSYQMLLGREAIRRRFRVDPSRSFLTGHPEAHEGAKKPQNRGKS